MENKPKYVSFGSVVDFGDGKMIQLDNTRLDQFVDYLREYGKKNLANLSDEEIRKAEKLPKGDPNKLYRLNLYLFNPHENAPDFVVSNLAFKND